MNARSPNSASAGRVGRGGALRPSRSPRAGLAPRARRGLAPALALACTLLGGCLFRSCSYGELEPHSDQVARYYQQGMESLARDDPARAADQFELALKLQPLLVPAKAHLGFARYKLRQYDRAIVELNDTVESFPDYADSYNYLGLVYEAKGDRAKAEEMYAVAIDTYPGYDDAYYNRAQLREKQNRFQEALADYEAAAASASGGKTADSKLLAARANTAAGLIYVRNGLRRDAKQRFQIAIDIGVPIPEAHFGIGKIHVLEEQWDEAILAFHTALLEPEDVWVRKDDVNGCKRDLAAAQDKAPKHIAVKLVDRAKAEHDKLRELPDHEIPAKAPKVLDLIKRWLYSASKVDPSLIDVRILGGRIMLEEGDIDRAGREAQAALKIDPKNRDARYLLALVYVARAQKREAAREAGAQNDWRAAERYLRELRRENPRELKYHDLLGGVYFRQEELRRAEREWREALLCEGSPKAKERIQKKLEALLQKPIIKKANDLNDSAVRALGKGQPDEAKTLIKQALSYDPLFAVAHANLAVAELELGNADLAMVIIDKALELDADLHFAYTVKGRLMRLKKDYAQALKLLGEAQRLYPFDPEVYYQEALCHHEQRRTAPAEKALSRAIGIQPEHVPSQVLLGQIYREQGLYDRAEVQLQLAIAHSDSKHAPAFIALGELLIATKRYDDAMKVAERAYELDPTSPEPWLIHAQAHEANGRTIEASAALLYAAAAQDARGSFDEAARTAARAVKLTPQNPSALDRLGLYTAKTGKLEEAVRHLRQALLLDANHLLARFDLGTVYEEMGERELAAECYRMVVKARPVVGDPENPQQVEAYWFPRFRLAGLYQPGRTGPVDRAEAVKLLHEAERAAPPEVKGAIRERLAEIER